MPRNALGILTNGGYHQGGEKGGLRENKISRDMKAVVVYVSFSNPWSDNGRVNRDKQ